VDKLAIPIKEKEIKNNRAYLGLLLLFKLGEWFFFESNIYCAVLRIKY